MAVDRDFAPARMERAREARASEGATLDREDSARAVAVAVGTRAKDRGSDGDDASDGEDDASRGRAREGRGGGRNHGAIDETDDAARAVVDVWVHS